MLYFLEFGDWWRTSQHKHIRWGTVNIRCTFRTSITSACSHFTSCAQNCSRGVRWWPCYVYSNHWKYHSAEISTTAPAPQLRTGRFKTIFFSIYFFAKSSFADNINPKVFEHCWFWHILKSHPEQMSAVLNDKKEDTFTLYTYSQKLWILSVVRFGDGLKILILTSGGAILNYKGALYQYKS